MKKYRNDMPNSYKSSGDAGCVKAPSEHKVEMVKSGGSKYSYDNPMELKQKADKLAKVLD